MITSKKILFTLNGINNFISHRLSLAKDLQAKGYEIHIATPPCAQEKITFLQNLGFHIYSYHFNRKAANPLEVARTLWSLKTIIHNVNPNIIVSVALKANLLTMLLHKYSSKQCKLVCLFTGLGMLYTRMSPFYLGLRPVFEHVIKYLSRNKNIFYIIQNPDDLAHLTNTNILPKARTYLIKGSGIDIKQFIQTPIKDVETVNVLFSGRLLKEKGIFDFIDAVELLNSEDISATHMISGDFDTKSPTKINKAKFITRVNNAGIQLIGWQRDMHTIYQRAHVICLPSYYREGIPKVLLEALACGKPIVTTNMPGCKETVIDGQNGFLVPPQNPLALASALKKLIQDENLRKKMGEKSRLLAETTFSQPKINAQMIEILEARN